MEDFYSMKKKLGLLLSVLLVVPIILTGCGRDGKKLLEEAMQNTSDIKSQKIDFTLSCEMGQSGISASPRLDFSMASDQDSVHLNFSMDSLLSSASFPVLYPSFRGFVCAKRPGYRDNLCQRRAGRWLYQNHDAGQ